jgi:16S rRNA processing protein RimM
VSSSNPVIIGCLGAVYGIKGWLKVSSYTQQAEAIFDYQPWLVGHADKSREVIVTEWRRHNKSLIVKLDGFDVREQSQTLTGLEILVNSEQLPELDGSEHYWRDLMGMNVVNRDGYDFGQVTDLMETGSNDVLVVKANLKDAFGKQERLIPFVESQVVDNVDIKTQTITVDWDPGF